MLEAGTEGNYKDDHPWLIAKELFEHAGSINQALPIMFACKDQDKESEFSHWSTISNVSVLLLQGHVGPELADNLAGVTDLEVAVSRQERGPVRATRTI